MPTNAPVTEIGYTQAPSFNWWLYENESTPELVWPQSIYVYDQMRRTDAQVGSVLRAVTETLLRTPWRIDPAGAKARVVKFVADDLGLPIVGKPAAPPPRLKDRFSWPSHLREALLMLPLGHAYFEQVYRISDDGSRAHLRKLAYRPAKTIEQINVAPDGGLISIKQWWTNVNTRPEPIPVDRLVAYIHAKEGGNWLGTSILRNCYKNWLIKDRLLRVQAQTIERNGMGIPLYKGQEDASAEDLAAGKAMATAWRAGEAAGSAVPFGADLILRGVEGTLPDAQPAIDYHDSQIARAVLAHFLNLGQQTGSWALGTTFADFFTMSLQTLAEQIRDTATQHIVEDLVDINFGEDEPAPRLVFDEIGSRQAATAAALKTLVDAGILHPDQVLEESSRQQYGLPPADPSTATPPPGAPTATPPAPTEMGDLSTAVAATAGPKGEAAEAADAPRAAPRRSRRSRRVAARFNPAQKRDPNGEWGDGAPGPSLNLPDLDMEGFDLAAEVEGTFGTLQLGVDELGDIRMAWHEGYEARAVDLGDNEVADLEPILHRLARYRDYQLPDDAESDGVYDDDRFGYDDGHKVELLGNGVISITFGADEPDPYTLNLDPPDPEEGTDDVQDVLQAIDDALTEASARTEGDAVSAAAGVDTHPGGEQLKHYWVFGEGAAKWSTWTELYHHLVKYLSTGMAKRTAAAWFHLRYGYWPGDHRNVHASADVEADEWEVAIAALVMALAELSGEVLAGAFDEAKHPRGPGGKFRSTVDKLKSAIQTHRSSGGKGDPFDGFDREQLRRAAKTSGISLGRGEDRDSIAKKLLSHLDEGDAKPAAPKAPAKKSAPRKRVDPMTKLTDEQLVNGVKMHGSEDGHGKKAADELKRRGVDLDGNPMAEPKPKEPKPVKKAAPRKAAPKKAATKPAEGRVAGSNLLDSAGFIDDVNAAAPSFHSSEKHLAAIAHRQGFDGKPKVVSKAELDALVAGGSRELWRGVEPGGGKTSAEINEEFRTGEAFYGRGFYGHGIYTGTWQHAQGFASDYTGKDGSMARMVLRPDARIADYRTLQTEWARYRAQFPAKSPEYLFYSDPSRYAAAQGYDAVHVTLEDSVVILNRTAVVIEERAT